MAENNSTENSTNVDYGEGSIAQLRGLVRVRDKVAVVFGSNTITGAFHTAKEILANSIDEGREGYGDKLEVGYYKDGSISIRDFGRGVPVGWNPNESQWNWHLVFNELYAGAKYGEEFDENGNLVGDYKESLGTNGMGAASTQYTSDFFDVVSKREDGIYKVSFRDGMPINKEGKKIDMHGNKLPSDEVLAQVLQVEENTTGETGTYIHWKISKDVFYNTNFTTKMFVDLLESQAHITGIDIVFNDEMFGGKYEFKGEGVLEYILSKVGKGNVTGVYEREDRVKGIEEGKQYDSKADIKLVITNEIESQRKFFHNTSEMTEGVHIEAFNSAVDQFFKEIAKQNDIKKIREADYTNNLSCIILTSANTSATQFMGQTKRGVENMFIYSMIRSNVYGLLQDAYAKQDKAVYEFVESVIRAAKARQNSEESAKQAKQIVNLVKEAETNKKKKFDSKLLDALNTDVKEREIFIVEGDGAAGAVIEARDKHKHAIIPIMGKMPNALKAEITELLENKIIMQLIQAIGTGIETGSDEITIFDIKKVKYIRINILTDADRDGYQIRVLLFAFFYRFMPQLLEQGYVEIVESPILKYTTTKGRYYVYNLEDKAKVEEQIRQDGARVQSVSRSKGLGSNSAEVMAESVLDEDNRRSEKIRIDTSDRFTQDVIDMLFGRDFNNERKGFILSMMGNVIEMDAMMRQMVETSLENDILEVGKEDEVYA